MSPPRMPPHDIDAERAVLAGTLLDADARAVVLDHLRPAHFFGEPNRWVWAAIFELSLADRNVDVVTVAGWLRDNGRMEQIGGSAYLAELSEAVPAHANLEEYATRIIDLARLRQVIAESTRIAAQAYEAGGEVQAFLDRAENSIYQLAHTEEKRDIAAVSEVAKETWDRIVAASKRRGRVELPTGLDRLDAKIGGLHDEEATVIAARPGMGKTGLVGCIACNVAGNGHGVAIFELEMPRHQLVSRFACSKAELDLHAVLQGFVRRDEWDLLASATDHISRLPIWIDDNPGATLLHVRAGARRVQVECKRAGRELKLVIVDYLQLMSSIDDRDVASREQEVSKNMRGLKLLARELKLPVIVLSQLNREVEKERDKRPGLSHLRDSGAIEQDADNVIFIYRPEYYLKEKTPDDDKGIAELIVAKQRNGPQGTVRVQFDAPTVTFKNQPYQPGDEPDQQAAFAWNAMEESQ